MILDISENILPQNGTVLYYPNFLIQNEADFLFNMLKENIQWQQESIKIFGKEIMQPRLTAFYGDTNKPYKYSGKSMNPLTFIPELILIKEKIETIENANFSSVLCNYYRNGEDSMGWHADNEKELGRNPIIASVSFGAERVFHLKHNKLKNEKVEVMLNHGSLLIMKDETQHFWKHAIHKSKKILKPRINLTFRIIY